MGYSVRRAAFFAGIAALFAFVLTTAAAGQQAGQHPVAEPMPQTLTVGVYVSPPFVMQEDGQFSGMAIELWEQLAGALDLDAEYVEVETLRELVDATVAGQVDVAVTNLTITQDRAQRIDFTHPWFDAGLRIMVNEDRGAGFWDLVRGLQESGHLRAYAWIGAIILAATILLTLFDRRFDTGFPRRWRDGLAESFHTVMSVATSGRPPSRKNVFGWVGRIWQGLWLVCGIAVLAYATSSITSVMTTLSLVNQINSVDDLSGRTVGVFTGSVAEAFVREAGIHGRAFAHIDEAVEALLDGRISAIVGDAPVLEYYTYTNPQLPVAMVGTIFEPDKYGFGLAHGSPLLRPLTVEVIGAYENGSLEEIRTGYFGDTR